MANNYDFRAPSEKDLVNYLARSHVYDRANQAAVNEAAKNILSAVQPSYANSPNDSAAVAAETAGYPGEQPQAVTPQQAANAIAEAAAAREAQSVQPAQPQVAPTPTQAQPSYSFRTNPYLFGGAAPVAVSQPQTATQVQAENPQMRQVVNDVAQVHSPLSMRDRMLVQQLAQMKNGWMQADAAGDEAAKQSYHDAAEGLRAYAKQIGADLSQFGADNASAAQMNGYLQADYANGVGDLLQGRTASDVYEEAYKYLKDKGYSDRAANAAATKQADAFHDKRIQNLGAAFTMYGISPDTGAMNDYGAGILSQLYREDPNAVSMLASMYATPIQQWQVSQNMAAARQATADKMALMSKQFEGQKDLANTTYGWQRLINSDNNSYKDKWAGQEYALKNRALDIDQVKAELLAARNSGGDGFTPSGEKLTQSQKEGIDGLANMLMTATESVGQSHVRADDRDAVDACWQKLKDLKDNGKIDYDTYVTYYDRLATLNNQMQEKWRQHDYADSF